MATIKGKWRWNEVIDLSVTLGITSGNIPSGFISNGKTYYNLYVLNDVHWTPDPRVCDCLIYGNNMDVASHFKDDGSFVWAEQEYRLMDFGETEQEISDGLYAFILANATEYSPIAEKLVEVANNVEKVFEAGKQQGHGEGYKSGYNAGLEEGKELGGYNEGFEAGKTEGKQDEYDAFWNAFQSDKGNPHNYQYTFCNYGWNDETFKPKYDIVFGLGFTGTNTFWGCKVTNIAESLERRGLKMDTTLCGYCTSMFQGTSTKRLPELNFTHAMDYNGSGLQNTFLNSLVETIDKIIVPEGLKYSSTFQGCANLKNIVFEGVIGENINFQWSTLLTRASIESILNALSDTATGKTLTLSNDAVYEAFALRDDDGNKLPYLEGIWAEYIYIKSNWTITLV